MIVLRADIPVAATTADLFYIPVPCRGTIAKAYAVYNQETDLDEVFTLMRGASDVMTFTPAADGTAEGVKINGVLDSTNGQLIFDPDSSTAANQVIKVEVLNTVDTAGVLGLTIYFDESAYVTQDPSEA